MSETDSFPRNGDAAEPCWLVDNLRANRVVLKRLHSLKKHLGQRAISSIQASSNGRFSDVALNEHRVCANRSAQRSALFFWGLRYNLFISELTGGAVLSLWRRAQLAAKYDPAMLSVWSHARPDQSWPVLCAVLEHVRNCPTLLAKFSRHSSTAVRTAVAENLYTDLATMFTLCGDADLDLRYSIAENPHAPIAILQKLTGDANPYIAERARRTVTRLMGGDVRTPRFGKPTAEKKRRISS